MVVAKSDARVRVCG